MTASILPAHSFLHSRDLDLNTLVVSILQPTAQFNEKCSIAIDALAKFITTNVQRPYSVAEVIKGGSLGKGTAIKDKCDLDLILVLNGYETFKQYTDGLDAFKLHLGKIVGGYKGEGCNFEVVQITGKHVEVSLTFTECNETFKMRADLVPSMSHTDCSLHELYKEMHTRSSEERKHYSSASIMESKSIQLVREQQASVKNVIRLVKYWKNTHVKQIPGGPKIPTSYPLELLTIWLWEQAGSPNSFKLEQGFRSVLQSLIEYKSMRVSWNIHYPDSEIATHYIEDEPYILHPVNPFQNVAARFSWVDLARMAQLSVASPAMLGVVIKPNWQ